jgi:hypothetical protein
MQPFWYDGAAVSVPAGVFVAGKRSLLWVCNGASVVFYVDGLSIGSAAVATNSTFADANHVLHVGSNQGFGQPFSEYARHLSIYAGAFDAASALDWHRSSLRMVSQ